MNEGRATAAAGTDADPSIQIVAQEEVRHSARIAGLKDFETPTLEQVERRRFELLGLVFFILLVLAVGLVVLSSGPVELPEWLEQLGATATLVRVLVVALAAALAFYVFEKERHLARLSKMLVNERVLGAALSNRLKEISALTEAGKAVVSFLELEDVLNVILNAASELLEADEGSVLLVDGEELTVAAATGHASAYIGQRGSMNNGLSGYVATNREPLLIEGNIDLAEFGEWLPDRERAIRSAASVPLEAKGELLGILNLNVTTGERRFNEYDLRALSLFGEHAAMAIRHARALRKERELRTRVAELDRIRAELVGTMTHDLKTPLTTILGSAKLLLGRADEVDADRRAELMESIERQAQRLLGLIDRLLDAARSQARYALAPGPIDVVSHVEPLATSYASAHDRRVLIERASEQVQAFADPDALEQIVANLLENAVRHTPPECTITVRIGRSDGAAEVSVADDGPGIPQEDLPYLFEPFRRGNTGRQGAGVGLGLFIVGNLVRAMGGQITVSSEPGEGAEFTFTLPSEAGEGAIAAPSGKAEGSP